MNKTKYIQSRIKSNIVLKERIISNCITAIESTANILITTLRSGNKIFWAGNGGSAADAQHMSAELMGGLKNHDRKPFASIALTTDTSFITAWSNDTNYETIFSRQIEGLGKEDDTLIAISTSGNSQNIINAIKISKKMGLNVIGLTNKDGGEMLHLCNIIIQVPSLDTQLVQEGHLMIEHIICELIESDLK